MKKPQILNSKCDLEVHDLSDDIYLNVPTFRSR